MQAMTNCSEGQGLLSKHTHNVGDTGSKDPTMRNAL